MTLHHTIYDIRLWCTYYSCYWITSSLSLHSCARSHMFALVCVLYVGILHINLIYTISWMTDWWLYITRYVIFACDVYTAHVIGARRCFPFTHAHVLTCLSECVSGWHIYISFIPHICLMVRQYPPYSPWVLYWLKYPRSSLVFLGIHNPRVTSKNERQLP